MKKNKTKQKPNTQKNNAINENGHEALFNISYQTHCPQMRTFALQ